MHGNQLTVGLFGQAFSLQFVLSAVVFILVGTGVLHWLVSVLKGSVVPAVKNVFRSK